MIAFARTLGPMIPSRRTINSLRARTRCAFVRSLLVMAAGLAQHCASTSQSGATELAATASGAPSGRHEPSAAPVGSSSSPSPHGGCTSSDAPGPPQGPAETAALALRSAQRALAARLASAPPDVRTACDERAIGALRTAARAYLAASLTQGVGAAERDPRVISEALLAPLQHVRDRECPDATDGSAAPSWAESFEITGAERPQESPDWLAVQTRAGAWQTAAPSVAQDTALYIFRRGDSAWNLVFADETPDSCNAQSACRTNYGPTLVGTDERDGPYVASAYFRGCEGSASVTLEYQVLAIGSDPLSPRRLLRETVGPAPLPDRNVVPGGVVTVRERGFDVTYAAGQQHRVRGRVVRSVCEMLARYSIRAGRVTRSGAIQINRATCRDAE